MNTSNDDTGLMTVLIERYEKQRQPRAVAIKTKVDQGELLNNFDLLFLKEVSDSINDLKPFLNRHPECHQLATHMMNLCKDIAEKGLENEKAV